MRKGKKGINWLRNKFRHGLMLYGITNQLSKIGIVITPFYWEKEYVKNCKTPVIDGDVSEYNVRELNSQDLKILSSMDGGFSLHEKLDQLKKGQICMGLLHREKIVAYSWIELSKLKYRKLKLSFNDNESYLGGMYTVQNYRGKNLAAYLRFNIYQFLKEKDRSIIYSISDYYNKPAIKFKAKLNSKHTKLYLYISLFNKFSKIFTLKNYK